MKLQDRAPMGDTIAHDGAQDTEVVDMLRYVREQLAYGNAALSILAKLPGGFQQGSGIPFGEGERPLERERLAVIPGEQRLRVKGVDMRGTTVHEHEDDALRPGFEVWLSRRYGV
jgi:hypothetical protein